jgi:RNA polymerase sigma-70 factor (ECF subfamily)
MNAGDIGRLVLVPTHAAAAMFTRGCVASAGLDVEPQPTLNRTGRGAVYPVRTGRVMTVSDAEASSSLDRDEGLRAAYAAHSGELYRFARRSLGDDGAAQDVVQETFLRAWRSAHRYDPALASLRVWLFAIARNVVVDSARATKARPWLANLSGDQDPDSGAHPDPSERLLRGWVVEEALRRIGTDHRAAIIETYLRDRPYAEVASEMQIPVATLRTRVFYGLRLYGSRWTRWR